MGASLVTAIRILGDHVDVGGDVDAFGIGTGGRHVGDVHDAGVGLTQRHLGDDALTFSSSDFGVTVTPALPNTVAAYLPHGTSGAQVTTIRSGLARSATPVIPFGLPGRR